MKTGYIPPGTAMQSLRAVCDAYDLPLEVRSALETHLRLTVDATIERCALVAESIATELFLDLSAKGDCHRAADIIADQIRALNTRLSV